MRSAALDVALRTFAPQHFGVQAQSLAKRIRTCFFFVQLREYRIYGQSLDPNTQKPMPHS
jgi:hypothetical protein